MNARTCALAWNLISNFYPSSNLCNQEYRTSIMAYCVVFSYLGRNHSVFFKYWWNNRKQKFSARQIDKLKCKITFWYLLPQKLVRKLQIFRENDLRCEFTRCRFGDESFLKNYFFLLSLAVLWTSQNEEIWLGLKYSIIKTLKTY